jgi:hypothetical protein
MARTKGKEAAFKAAKKSAEKMAAKAKKSTTAVFGFASA